jgi:transposase-like protein
MEKKKREIELEEKKRKWAGHIKECGESGKSQVQYCREQGLSIKLFYYWKRKLQEKQEDGVRLVPVRMQVVQVSRTESIATPLVLILGQYKVEIGPGFDSGTLGRVIQVLEQV